MSDSESSGAEDFLGFDQETIHEATNRYRRGLEEGSDIEFSDNNYISDDSSDDNSEDGEMVIDAAPKEWTKKFEIYKSRSFY